ncbi:MAG: DoxX family membrane protein [Acidobacteria bacterium]|nr:DoxX family membrane protein [Acidobacteriota bacterium]
MNWPEITHSALRIAAGLFFFPHGAQKVFGLWGRDPVNLASQIGFGGLIELIGGLMILVGFKTRWAAFLCSGTMAVAFWQMHVPEAVGKLGFPHGLHPLLNGGELAALFCFVFLFLWGNGGGSFSVDAWLARRGKR